MGNHYIDNTKFLEAIIEYKKKLQTALANNEPKPMLPNYIGECFMKISSHLSYRPNFINYTYREDMVSDGIENCLKCVDNFNPEKSSNPFAYFTQIIYYAFLRRIHVEKTQTYVKGKMILNLPFDAFDLQEHDEDKQFTNSYLDFVQTNNVYGDIIEKEEARQKSKRDKKIKPLTSLEEFLNEITPDN